MKQLVLALLLFSIEDSYALEEKTKLKCKGVYCVKETQVINATDAQELKMSDLVTGSCLVDLKTNTTSKVLETEAHSKKIVVVTEDGDGFLSRIVTFYDKKDFDRMQRIMPCDQTNTITLRDFKKTEACLKTSSQYARKYFCEKERRKNF